MIGERYDSFTVFLTYPEIRITYMRLNVPRVTHALLK